MQSMNAQMNMPQLQAIMREFEMQSDQLEQKQEMMEDAMDSALDEGDEDEEADALVNQVFEEIGISRTSSVPCRRQLPAHSRSRRRQPKPTIWKPGSTHCETANHSKRLGKLALADAVVPGFV